MMRIVSFELPGKSWYRLRLALSRMLGNRSRRGISTIVKANNQLRGRQHVRKEVSCQRRSRQTGKYQAYFSYKVKGFYRISTYQVVFRRRAGLFACFSSPPWSQINFRNPCRWACSSTFAAALSV